MLINVYMAVDVVQIELVINSSDLKAIEKNTKSMRTNHLLSYIK